MQHEAAVTSVPQTVPRTMDVGTDAMEETTTANKTLRLGGGSDQLAQPCSLLGEDISGHRSEQGNRDRDGN